MSYTLHGIDLSTYGFQATRAPGSNVALEGFLDMPDRINKVFHDWGDEEGVEPYLDTEEMQWGGRDLHLHGIIQGSSEADAHAKAFDFKQSLLAFEEPVSLSHATWGTFSVLVLKVEMHYLDHGVISLVIKMREPVVPAAPAYVNGFTLGTDVPADGAFRDVDGIDGVSFDDMGLISLRFSAYLNRPELKEGSFKSYTSEGYQIRRAMKHEVEWSLFIKNVNFTAFKNTLNGLYSALSASGLRYLTQANNALAGIFIEKGFKVSQLRVNDNEVSALIQVPLILLSDIYPIWVDRDGKRIVDETDDIFLLT